MDNEKKLGLIAGLIAVSVFGYISYNVFFALGAIPCSTDPTQIRGIQTQAEKDATIGLLKSNTLLNSTINGIFTGIDSHQTQYFATNGSYWYGQRTHSKPVEYGISELANNWDCDKSSWKKGGVVISQTLPAQIQVLVITKPNGSQSYTISASLQKGGVQYTKSKVDGKIIDWYAYE